MRVCLSSRPSWCHRLRYAAAAAPLAAHRQGEGVVATKQSTAWGAARALFLCGIALITAAPRPVRDIPPQQQRKNLASAIALLQSNQPLKINAYYACILNDRAQGLSLAQAQDDCLIRLQKDGRPGADNPLDALGLGAKQFFD